ncbi:hypothetical protein M2306_002060 [Myroides gitamensis]|nr:hypothetical protein [Myroides gitamensis]
MRKINGGLLQLYSVIGPVVEKLVEFGGAAFDAVANGLEWLVTKLEEGNPWIYGFAIAVGAVILALAIMKTGMFLAAIGQAALTTVTNLSSLAWWKLNAAMLANPITWIIAGVIALLALIGFLIYKIDGWGEAWEHTVSGVKHLWNGMLNGLKLGWLGFSNAVLNGLDLIRLAFWNNLALMGNKKAKQEMGEIIHGMAKRQKEITDTENEMKADFAAYAESGVKAYGSLSFNDKDFGDFTNEFKASIGFGDGKETSGIADTKGTPGTQQIDTSINTSQGAQNNSNAAATTANGGTKHNYITISLNDLIGVVNINKAGFQESVEDMEGEVTDALLRLLGSAVNAGN